MNTYSQSQTTHGDRIAVPRLLSRLPLAVRWKMVAPLTLPCTSKDADVCSWQHIILRIALIFPRSLEGCKIILDVIVTLGPRLPLTFEVWLKASCTSQPRHWQAHDALLERRAGFSFTRRARKPLLRLSYLDYFLKVQLRWNFITVNPRDEGLKKITNLPNIY